MTGELKPIRSKADYKRALAELERLWGAKIGTPQGDRLDVLATLIDAYEAEQYPIDPPDPIEGHQVSNGAAGFVAKGPRASHRHAYPCGGGLESQTQPFDRHDPSIERTARYFGRGADPSVAEEQSRLRPLASLIPLPVSL
jgi:hypothetical protein